MMGLKNICKIFYINPLFRKIVTKWGAFDKKDWEWFSNPSAVFHPKCISLEFLELHLSPISHLSLGEVESNPRCEAKCKDCWG